MQQKQIHFVRRSAQWHTICIIHRSHRRICIKTDNKKFLHLQSHHRRRRRRPIAPNSECTSVACRIHVQDLRIVKKRIHFFIDLTRRTLTHFNGIKVIIFNCEHQTNIVLILNFANSPECAGVSSCVHFISRHIFFSLFSSTILPRLFLIFHLQC